MLHFVPLRFISSLPHADSACKRARAMDARLLSTRAEIIRLFSTREQPHIGANTRAFKITSRGTMHAGLRPLMPPTIRCDFANEIYRDTFRHAKRTLFEERA